MHDIDPLDLYGQDRASADASDRAANAAQIEIADIQWLMRDQRGRRFVADLLDRAGVWRLSFDTNALSMAFNEGARNVGLKLLADITTYCPNCYTKMLKERSS